MSDDKRWTDLEDATAAMLDSWYRRYVGLEFDPAEAERSAEAVSQLAEEMATAYRHDPDAWGFLSTIIMFACLTPLDLEIEKLNEEHFTFEDILLDGRPVTPYSRWQYLYQEDDPEKRHELLSRITRGHPAVDEALVRYRAQQDALAQEWDYTPLDDFILAEGLDLPQLRGLLIELASAMRPSFERHFAENRAAVLGDEQGEPWEDFVTLFLNRWSVVVDKVIPSIDGVAAVRRVAVEMGFVPEAITVDLEDRPRKVPGASAWNVRVPDDVRLSVKPVGPSEDITFLYHEMGHALHFISIDPELPYYIRGDLSSGVAETFSFWLEHLLSDPLYLGELGMDERASAEMVRYGQLGRAAMATFTTVQALCVVDYWAEGPFSLDELGFRVSRYLAEFMGLAAPAGFARILQSFVQKLSMFALGYPVAYVRLGHLLNQLEAVQRDWWHSVEAVDIVRGYMRGGRQPGFPSSMLDTGPFIQRYANV
jgi:hypothetical protein